MKVSRFFALVLLLSACGSDKGNTGNAGIAAGFSFVGVPGVGGSDSGKGGTGGAATTVGAITGTVPTTTSVGGTGAAVGVVTRGAGGFSGKGDAAGGSGGKGGAAGGVAGVPSVDAATAGTGSDAGAKTDGADVTEKDAGPPSLPALDDQTPPLWTNGIRIDEKGFFWIADGWGSQLLRINPPPDTKIVERYGEAQGVYGGPDDLVIDENFVYWTGFLDGIVGKFDRRSGQSTVIANTGVGSNPIVFGKNRRLLVGRTEFGTGLFEVDPAGKTAPRTISADVDSNGFDLAPDGFLYGPSWNNLIKVDLTTGTFETLVDGFTFICSVRFNPLDGYLYVLETLPASVYRVALDGSSKQLFATLSAEYFADNFVIAKDGTLFITRFSNPIVTRVSADGATIEDFTIGE